MKNFIPHGNCSFLVEENIIIIDAMGPWNLEFFQLMHRELAAIILDQVNRHNFAILLVLKGDSLAVKDGLDYHLDIVKSGATKALAINASMSNAPKITTELFTSLYNRAGLVNKSFDTTSAAKIWLRSQLA